MIQVEIEVWQEMKVKLAQLERQVDRLKADNKRLRKRLDLDQNEEDFDGSKSSGNISISQHVKNKYSKVDQIIQMEDQTYNFDSLSPQKNYGKYLSVNLQNPGMMSRYHDANKQNSDDGSSDFSKSLSNEDAKSIRVSRKSDRELELKNLITSNKSSEKHQTKELRLIEQICVFGPTLSPDALHNVTFKNDQKQLVDPVLYYPQNSSDYQHYGNYLFPGKCRIKPTQKTHIQLEGNKILFKSSKKQDCNIFIFQGNQKLHPINEPNQMLDNVNPSKWLYAIVIEFNDFVFKQYQQKKIQLRGSEEELDQVQMQSPTLNVNKRTSLLDLNMKVFLEEQIRMETVSLKDIELESEKMRMYRSKFCLCIFTYFPFVTFLQNIILAIFDQVKLKRIQQYPLTGEFKDTDIFYFIKEVNSLAKKIKSYFGQRSVKLGKQLTLNVNETQLHIDLSKQFIYEELYSNWAYKIIKLMDKETFYEIYCMIMLEESVTFVCEDQKLLTLIILLFASMMTKPFSYPYPVVSILFTEELLQTPFTSIVGINQSESWLNYAIQHNFIDYENKQIVVVTQNQVKIRRNGSFNVPKSQRLKRVFNKFYKKTEHSSLSTILLRKESLPLSEGTKQAGQYVIHFLAKLQIFYHQNIFAYLPNNMEVQKKPQSQGETCKVQVRNDILNEIEKEYKKSNPHYVKDQFIRQFIKTEIFSIYLMNEYKLQA